jgi:putative ABC transport system substrate-binding protein
MKRREFIAGLGSAAAWPVVARAQQAAMPVIGFLNAGSPEAYAPYVTSFRRGLREAGYLEGENVAIEFRWASGQYERLPEMAAELVRRPVRVIVANTPAWQFAKAATTTIPIIFSTTADPVQAGLVQSLSRPGGNITGATTLILELGPKRLELLHELVPMATTLALLINPTNPVLAETELRNVEAAARTLGVQLHLVRASTEQDIDTVFGTLAQVRVGGLLIGPDPFFNTRYQQLARLSVSHAVPAIYEYREFVAAGGMMSYGGSLTEQYRLVGNYTGRILKGEKPADLPVVQSTKVELIINLKTAKALGITFPLTLLGRADEVIE